MKGRWTRASQGQPLEFFAQCERNHMTPSFGSYTEVCRATDFASNLRFQSRHQAMLTYETTNRTLFAYDNEVGLAAKLCTVKNEALDATFGIAAYDVDYDDYANECGVVNKYGKHSRLKALRKITDYYRNLPNQLFDQELCMRVVSS
ncbi:uncharacterized protein LOC144100663 [Amblyomma americanum]